VTTARDLGARSYLDIVVRDAIARAEARGPRMVVATRPITVTGGHCWFMGAEADSEDDLRRMVRTHHKHGADLIKVMSTGGFMTTGSAPWYAQFTVAQLAAIVEEAARVDKKVAAHAHVAELTGRDVGQYVKPMHDLGVRIIAGTDAGIDATPHHQYVGGLEHLVTLGFSPGQVITMATTEAATALGVDGVTGRLAPGYEADLIVVDGDPQADISALGRLQRVVARGRDYVPDSGRFDVSAPGTPFASEDGGVDIERIRELTKPRQV
jgi:imidazolonepropionase-like amidohydrolase